VYRLAPMMTAARHRRPGRSRQRSIPPISRRPPDWPAGSTATRDLDIGALRLRRSTGRAGPTATGICR